MNIIVFGGSGFLGSHVADALSDAGHKVWIYGRKRSSYLRPDQEMILGDILDEECVREAVSGKDVVYHFAAIADLGEAKLDPPKTVRTNILGTVILLEAARHAKVQRFVFASSLYVYSEAGSFYRTSKYASELLIENYQEAFGLDHTILRYGSLYGPRADERNTIHRLLTQALSGGRLVYPGTGEEMREYVHAEDAARASVAILAPEYRNQHLIITGHQMIKVKDLLTMINEMMGGTLTVELTPSSSKEHYRMTPYAFHPRLGKKFIVSPVAIDMGQGLLHCLNEIAHTRAQAAEGNGAMVI